MNRIVQTPTLVAFLYEDGQHREIWMDGRALEPDPNPTWMGYSVGRWDGDVLVVESNGYTERSWLDFDGHPHTEQLRITERYTRPQFGRIEVQVTMVDPKAYSKPITFVMPMKLHADTEMLEAVCENHGRSRERIAVTGPGQAVEVPASTLSRYVGVYDVVGDSAAKYVVAITSSGSTLWLDYEGKGKEELLALTPSRFSWSGTIVEFAAGDGAMEMVLHYAEGDERGPKRK